MNKRLMRTSLSACATGILTLSALVLGSATAVSATLDEYCLAGGGSVVTKANPPSGTVTICVGGELDGTVLRVNR